MALKKHALTVNKPLQKYILIKQIQTTTNKQTNKQTDGRTRTKARYV